MTGSPEAVPQSVGRQPLILAPVLIAALVVLYVLPRGEAEDTATRLFIVLFLIMAAVDALTYRVPNLIVYPSIAFSLLATAIVDSGLLVDALAGGGATTLAMFILALAARGALGMGDVKAACFSGCVLGVRGGLVSLMFGFALGFAVALPVLLLRLRGRKDLLPLTPFLAAGAIIYGVQFSFLLGD